MPPFCPVESWIRGNTPLRLRGFPHNKAVFSSAKSPSYILPNARSAVRRLACGVLGTLICAISAFAQINISALEARAASGDAEAHNILGNAYVNGQGVERDIAQAISHYEQAADEGFAAAAFNLGLIHEVGRGVELDLPRAFAYYLRAAELGFPAAQFNVGNMYARGLGVEVDLFQSVIWMRRAADEGVADAQYNLGVAYETGQGVQVDVDQAIHWYGQAMTQDFARAAYNLALIYEEGNGVPRDDAEAARLYLFAAEKNHGPAQNNLGVMYAEGRGGLRQSLADAYGWFVLAAENGSSPRGRDMISQRLDRIQQADADVKLAALRNRLGLSSPATQPTGPTAPRVGVPSGAQPVSDSANEQLSSRLAELEAALNRLRRENTGLISSNQALARQKAELEQRNVQTPTLSGAAQAEIAHINSIARELAELESLAPDRRDLVQQAIALLERISRDNLRLNSEVKSATLELSSLSRRLRQAELSSGSGAGSASGEDAGALAAAEQRASDLDSQLTQAQARIQGLEAGVAAVGTMRQQIDELTQRNAELTNQISAAQPSGDAATLDPAALAAQAEELATLRVTAANQAAQLKTASQEVSALQTRSTELREALSRAMAKVAEVTESNDQGELNDLQVRVTELEAQLTTRESEIQSLQTDLEQSQQRADSLSVDQNRIAELSAELAAARDEAERTSMQLELASSRLRSAESAAQSSEQVAASAVSDATGRVAELNALLEREATLRSDLESQITAARSEITALTENREGSESVVAGLQNELRSTRDQLRQTDQIVAELTEENQRLQENQVLPSSEPSADELRLRNEIESQAQRIDVLRENRDQAQRRIAVLTAELSEFETRVADREARIASLENENTSVRAELATAANSQTVNDSDVSQLRDDLVSQRSQLAEKEELISQLASNVDQLEIELAASDNGDLAQLRTDLASQREQLAEKELLVGVTKTEPWRELVWESRKDPDHERQKIHDGAEDPHIARG